MARQRMIELLDVGVWAVTGICLGLALDSVIVALGIGFVIGWHVLVVIAANRNTLRGRCTAPLARITWR